MNMKMTVNGVELEIQWEVDRDGEVEGMAVFVVDPTMYLNDIMSQTALDEIDKKVYEEIQSRESDYEPEDLTERDISDPREER